jgi:hypothetical protein
MSFIILYFLTDTFARLGITVAFTVFFSVALMLVTQARRIEIFAATSAYAPVYSYKIGTFQADTL